MDDLTRYRVTYLKDWRNTSWQTQHGEGDRAEEQPAPGEAHAQRRSAPDRLTQAVRRQVIPKLVGAHAAPAASPRPPRPVGIDISDVVEFTGLVAGRDVSQARTTIERKRAQGMLLESLFVDLMIPSARRLADLWESDLCHYEEIAVGMLNLQQLLHDLTPAFTRERSRKARDRSALLLSAPCEQNMLGVFMVTEFYRCVASEFFHRDGWDVWPAPPVSLPRLLGIVSSQWFDLIEISATCGARISHVVADLAQLKRASRNADVGMVVCGPAFDEHPELIAQIGADACAHDANESLEWADAFVERLPARR